MSGYGSRDPYANDPYSRSTSNRGSGSRYPADPYADYSQKREREGDQYERDPKRARYDDPYGSSSRYQPRPDYNQPYQEAHGGRSAGYGRSSGGGYERSSGGGYDRSGSAAYERSAGGYDRSGFSGYDRYQSDPYNQRGARDDYRDSSRGHGYDYNPQDRGHSSSHGGGGRYGDSRSHRDERYTDSRGYAGDRYGASRGGGERYSDRGGGSERYDIQQPYGSSSRGAYGSGGGGPPAYGDRRSQGSYDRRDDFGGGGRGGSRGGRGGRGRGGRGRGRGGRGGGGRPEREKDPEYMYDIDEWEQMVADNNFQLPEHDWRLDGDDYRKSDVELFAVETDTEPPIAKIVRRIEDDPDVDACSIRVDGVTKPAATKSVFKAMDEIRGLDAHERQVVVAYRQKQAVSFSTEWFPDPANAVIDGEAARIAPVKAWYREAAQY